MLGIKVDLKKAQKAKSALIALGLLDKAYLPNKTGKELIFPILNKTTTLEKELGGKYTDDIFDEPDKKNDYKAYLKDQFNLEELKEMPASYDIIGDIIIIDIKENSKEKQIGDALLKSNKNIKVVLKKVGIHEGEFRTQPLSYVTGEKRKETTYKENGVSLKLDVEKVYFSPRLSSDRKRIYQQVKKGENILVMFSGCGPYIIEIAKNTNAEKITGIEKNPIAHKYALENVKINKTKNVTLINGDVVEEVPKLGCKFDRILMPLPKGAEDFLGLAFSVSKKGTIIHFYDFEHESELDNGEKKVIFAAKKYNTKVKSLNTVKCGQYSPGKYRICVDFIIN